MPPRSGIRQDILDFLSKNGPIDDVRGRATAALKQAVGYEGNDAAFTQIVSAMARAGQIERVVRGKRTYGVRLPGVGGRAATSEATTLPPPAAPVTVPTEGTSVGGGIDYDELAAVLLARVTRLISDAEHGASSIGWSKRRLERLETKNAAAERELARAKAELKEVEAERDDLKSRLEAAEHNLSVLSERHRANVGQATTRRAARHLGTEDRALLRRLTGQEHEETPTSEHTG